MINNHEEGTVTQGRLLFPCYNGYFAEFETVLQLKISKKRALLLIEFYLKIGSVPRPISQLLRLRNRCIT